MFIRSLVLIILIGLLSACSAFTQAEQLDPPPTPTTVRVIQTTPVPTVDRNMQTVATAPPDSSASPTPHTTCESTAGSPVTAHTVSADLDYRQQTVAVRQRIQYINDATDSLPQIVLDVEPNLLPGVFTIDTVTLADDVQVAAYELTGRRMTVDLPEPLAPGCTLELDLSFRLNLPHIGVGENGALGYLGYSARQINLGHWLPAVAVRQNGNWLLHDSPGVGEQTVLDPADWDVTLVVTGASDRLQVAAPGEVTQPTAGTWQFVLSGAREFTLSMSESFRLKTAQSENGVTVELYTFDDATVPSASGAIDSASHALDVATRALGMYSDLFGDYPHPRYLVVEGDFPDGMEFSDIVFVSGDWFRTYAGAPTSYLTIITVHETSHQWWYSRVSSDQAETPWLDEALATYSEYIFYEEYYPDLKDWWWRFRVDTFLPAGYDDHPVDSGVYEFTVNRDYINAVYLHGARMLHDLRRDVGTEAFFDWLRRYAEAGTGRIATADLFWSPLTPEQMEATRATRNHYLTSAPEETAEP
jgi:hypothetical protein